MSKPVNETELAARLRKLLRMRALQQLMEEKQRDLETTNRQLQAQNEELEAMAGQLEAQNQQLIAMTGQLRAQNHELEAMAGQLEAQNQQLVEMAEQLAAANQQLAHLSVTDGLTQIHNRRYFEERLRGELARASRHGAPLSCVLIDLDRFKEINDTHGHLVGDRVLAGLVEILNGCVREEDTVCRYGGDEFAILLPETAADCAHELAERLRETVAATRFSISGADDLAITVSAGVVDYSPSLLVPDPHALVNAADQALLRAKRNGRNRVELEPKAGGH